MQKFVLPFFMLTLVLNSCSTNDTAQMRSVPVTRKEMQSEVVKTMANLVIEGMTCSGGCGGKIQQELRSLHGVKTTDLDFEENRLQNVVRVEYNPSEISEQEMIKSVDAIESGDYSVVSVEIVQYKGIQGTGGTTSTTDSGIQTTTGIHKVVQVFDLLRSFRNLVQ